MANVFRESLIQLPGLRFADPLDHLDPRSLQSGDTASANQRIRIAHGDEDATNSGGNHLVSARPSAAHMRAGFQVQIERRTTRAYSSLFDRQHLGVSLAGVGV